MRQSRGILEGVVGFFYGLEKDLIFILDLRLQRAPGECVIYERMAPAPIRRSSSAHPSG